MVDLVNNENHHKLSITTHDLSVIDVVDGPVWLFGDANGSVTERTNDPDTNRLKNVADSQDSRGRKATKIALILLSIFLVIVIIADLFLLLRVIKIKQKHKETKQPQLVINIID